MIENRRVVTAVAGFLFLCASLVGGCASVPSQEKASRAIHAGNVEEVNDLLENGLNPNGVDEIGMPWLVVAANADGTGKIVNAFLDKGANPNIKTGAGHTPLHKAVSLNNAEITKILLDKGADPKIKDEEGKQPLHYALENDNREIMRIFVDHDESKSGQP